MDTAGKQLVDWVEIQPHDIVIIPAFGTTIEIQQQLERIGVEAHRYDTTCPFVEKVWNRAEQIGKKDYTIVVHGKPTHEETRATFSHSKANAPTVVVKNIEQTQRLARYVRGEGSKEEFYEEFKGQYSAGFDPTLHLQRIGVVNQTTMLASDTQGIADYLKSVMIQHYQLAPAQVEQHFANTRDTLCYATNDNQDATYALLTHPADLAIVAGGYNSSNTSHIVELCEQKLPTYFIESASKILDQHLIRHFNLHTKEETTTTDFLPPHRPLTIMLTCGASCPDATIEGILVRLLHFFEAPTPIPKVMQSFLG